MSLCSRIGDMGRGYCTGGDGHGDVTGTIYSGAGKSLAEGSNIARMNDIIISDCSHHKVGTIIEGSGTVFVEGSLCTRLGDSFDGAFSGTILEGAGTVLVGG